MIAALAFATILLLNSASSTYALTENEAFEEDGLTTEERLSQGSHQFLYVWAGQNTNVTNAADFVAVVDWDPSSAQYGKVVKYVPLVTGQVPGCSQSQNEPHHVGLSQDGKYFAAGGLLSFLYGQDEVFVYEVPKKGSLFRGPKLLYTLDPPGACTDVFRAVGGSHFVISQMCNDSATNQGVMLTLNAATGEYGYAVNPHRNNEDQFQDFNPHGFVVYDDGTLLVGDYINPASLAQPDPALITFRDTIRYFNSNGLLDKSLDVPVLNAGSGVGTGNGFMDIINIPNDKLRRGFTMGGSDNQLYLVSKGKQPIPVFDLTVITGGVPHLSGPLFAFGSRSDRLVFTFQFRFVVLMNVKNPEKPVLLQAFDFCGLDMSIPVYGSTTETISYADYCANNGNLVGSHTIMFPKPSNPSVPQNRFVVFNYFLNFGLAQLAGTRTIHTFVLSNDGNSFTIDTGFNPNTQITGAKWGSPHSAIYVDDFPSNHVIN